MSGYLKFSEFYDPYKLNLYSVSNYESSFVPAGEEAFQTEASDPYITENGSILITE